MTTQNPFKYFKTPPEIIRLAVKYCIRYPLSLRQMEDTLLGAGMTNSYSIMVRLKECKIWFLELRELLWALSE